MNDPIHGGYPSTGRQPRTPWPHDASSQQVSAPSFTPDRQSGKSYGLMVDRDGHLWLQESVDWWARTIEHPELRPWLPLVAQSYVPEGGAEL